MKSAIGIANAGMMLAALLTTAFAARADTAERSYQLQTRIVEQAPGVGEFDGALQLRVSTDGIVSGFYRPADAPRFIPVSGGVTGDRLWLEIGTFAAHPMHFNGTFRNGKIDAQSNQLARDNGRNTALELIGIPKSF